MLAGLTLGLVTGTLLGLLGGGGSIIAVPILVYVAGLETKIAIGTSLLIVGLASILAALIHYRNRQLVVNIAIFFGLAGMMGSFAGAFTAHFVPGAVQLALFSCLMFVIGLIMFGKDKNSVEKENFMDSSAKRTTSVIFSGAGAGFLTGLLGVGGGFIIVPALSMVLGLPIKKAIGTSLVIIGFNSIAGALAYSSQIRLGGMVNAYAAGTLVAAPVAGYFAYKIEQSRLKRSFAIFLMVLSTWMIAKQFIPV